MSAPPSYNAPPANPDARPLPEGWVTQFDNNYRTWFYVNTRAQPPVITWDHPLGPPPPYPPPSHPPPAPAHNNYQNSAPGFPGAGVQSYTQPGPYAQSPPPPQASYNQSGKPHSGPATPGHSGQYGGSDGKGAMSNLASPAAAGKLSKLFGKHGGGHGGTPGGGFGHFGSGGHGKPPKKHGGMGGGAGLALGAGAGLLGGLLVADAIDDGFDDDFGGGGDFDF